MTLTKRLLHTSFAISRPTFLPAATSFSLRTPSFNNNQFTKRCYGAGYPHPTRSQALERILEILSQHENVAAEPKEDSTLEELGFNLLDRVELCHEIEEQFGCRITDDDGFNAETVADLTNIIVDHPNSKWYRL